MQDMLAPLSHNSGYSLLSIEILTVYCVRQTSSEQATATNSFDSDILTC